MVILVRYVLPAVIVLAGFVLLVASPEEIGLEGWAVFVGAGLSIGLLNLLYRFGAAGDAERDAEDDARRYFDEHGYWPDQAPDATRRG